MFGTSSCELDIGYTLSEAVFYTSPNFPTISVGTRQTASIDASLLCLISANASLSMYDIYTATLPDQFNLTMGGIASICGSLGPCPFCIHGCKDLGISATVGTGGFNYHISY